MANALSRDRDVVAEVKAAVDIVDVINGYLDLKPAGGARFKALCPFHTEKTPSFHVSRDRQTFHCFGCGKGGDLLTFVMDIEGIGFREALENLADRAGIRIESFSPARQGEEGERSELMKCHAFAARFFFSKLRDEEDGAIGRKYLETRGFPEEMWKRFGLGFVPEGWQHLTDAARSGGIKESTLEQSGLAKRGDRGLYDRFRNRLIFPIRNASGKVVAFGGRTLGDDTAKYINSPENAVYKKGRILYGLFEGREALRQEQEAIVVEGYFDLLRCVEMGLENVVATCGTALTTEQATLLRRYVPKVLVVFDGDEAGIRAALRSVGVLVAAGLSVRAMVLPDGQDPDDYLSGNGADAFRTLASAAPHFVEFYVRMNSQRTETIEGRTEVAKELFGVLGDLNDPVRQDEYVKLLGRELGLDAQRLHEAFGKHQRDQRDRSNSRRDESETKDEVDLHDREFIAILLADEGQLKQVLSAVPMNDLERTAVLEVIQCIGAHAMTEILQHLESDAAKRLFSAASTVDDTWGNRGEDMVCERIIRFEMDAQLQERERIREGKYRAHRLGDEELEAENALKEIEINRAIQETRAKLPLVGAA